MRADLSAASLKAVIAQQTIDGFSAAIHQTLHADKQEEEEDNYCLSQI